MKRPQIIHEGFNLNVTTMRWDKEGELTSVSFYDLEGEYQMAFQINPDVDVDQGVIYKDLKKCLIL